MHYGKTFSAQFFFFFFLIFYKIDADAVKIYLLTLMLMLLTLMPSIHFVDVLYPAAASDIQQYDVKLCFTRFLLFFFFCG